MSTTASPLAPGRSAPRARLPAWTLIASCVMPAWLADAVNKLMVNSNSCTASTSTRKELDTRATREVTASGTVTAKEIIVATHSPKGVHLVHTEMPVHREYGIAMEWDAGSPPGPGTFWRWLSRAWSTAARPTTTVNHRDHKEHRDHKGVPE